MSKDNNKSMLKAIAELLRRLFKSKDDATSNYGGFGGEQASVDSADDKLEKDIKALESVHSEIKESVQELIDDGDFLTAYLLEHQSIALEVQIIASKEGLDSSEIDIDKLSREAEKRINDSIDKLNSDNTVKMEFQDYHNHDAEKLSTSMEKSLDISATITGNSDLESSTVSSLNSSLANITQNGVERFSQSPQSHAQDVGLEPNDSEIKAENDRQEKLSAARQMQAEQELEEYYEQEMGNKPVS